MFYSPAAFARPETSYFLLIQQWGGVFQQYTQLSYYIWHEGLLIDFLQKKLTDNILLVFFIVGAYLFNERVIADLVVYFFHDTFAWVLTRNAIPAFVNLTPVFTFFLISGTSLYLMTVIPWF